MPRIPEWMHKLRIKLDGITLLAEGESTVEIRPHSQSLGLHTRIYLQGMHISLYTKSFMFNIKCIKSWWGIKLVTNSLRWNMTLIIWETTVAMWQENFIYRRWSSLPPADIEVSSRIELMKVASLTYPIPYKATILYFYLGSTRHRVGWASSSTRRGPVETPKR